MSKLHSRSRTPETQHLDRIGLAALHVVAFISGSAIMVLEIIGTRVIGPIFGVTLFVWAALLAVTLASLALGYYFGGVLIDRHPGRRLMGAAIFGGGLSIALASIVSATVLRVALAFGPRMGPMVSAGALFGPGLIALGMVAPMAIRLAANDPNTTGHRAGSLSAVSTAGSLVATCATAFVFIPSFETRHILQATASLLMLVGALISLRNRAVLAGAALLLPFAPSALSDAQLPPGFAVLAQAQSAYGLVQVIDDYARNVRLLRSDHSIIGAAYTNSSESPFEYIDILESVRCIRPEATQVLQLGLGTGTLATALRRHQSKVDVIEIDPNVVRFAADYFAFSGARDVVVDDARTWLRTSRQKYDVVIHDTFTGGATPENLLSLEALTSVRLVLRPGGLLAMNFVGYTAGANAAATWAVARTVAATFKYVRLYRDDSSERGIANVIFFASDTPLEFGNKGVRDLDASCTKLLGSYASWKALLTIPKGAMLTDAENPMAQLSLPAANEHFDSMNQLLPIGVWLNTSANH